MTARSSLTAAPTRAELTDAGCLGALGAVALWSFRSSFGGIEFLAVGVAGLVLGVLLALVAARLRWPPLVVIAATVVVHLVAGTTVALRRQALAGFLPTPSTLRQLLETPVRGWAELLTTVPPIGSAGSLLVLPFVCGLVCGATGFSFARRRRSPALPLLPPVVVLALGILCGTLRPVSVLVLGAGFGLLALAWLTIRQRRLEPEVLAGSTHRRGWGAAVAMLVVCAAVGWVLGPALPTADARDRVTLRERAEPPLDPRELASPLNGYRRYVRERKDEELLEVRGAPAGTRIRLATMDRYDGLVWGVAGGTAASADASGTFVAVGSVVDPPRDGERVRLTVRNVGLDGIWLPTVGDLAEIDFGGPRADRLAASFRYNRATGTGAVTAALAPGDTWSLEAVRPAEAGDSLRGRAVRSVVLPDPENVSPKCVAVGAEIVGELADPYERIRTLIDTLKTSGFYSDGTGDTDEQRAGGTAGHGLARLEQFAADRSRLVGNAEQYAAAAALMARGLKLPARVVMGFQLAEDATSEWVTLTGDDMTAWVEVGFEGAGWVAFDPTPDRSRRLTAQTPKPLPSPRRETQVPPPPPIVEPETQPAAADETDDEKKKQDQANKDRKEAEESRAALRAALIVVGAASSPLLVVGLVAGTIVGLKARRRRRRRQLGTPVQRIANGWREVVDVAHDHGRAVPNRCTRREAAAFIGTGDAEELARATDAAVFGRAELDEATVEDVWRRADDVRRSLGAEAGAAGRLKAAVSVTSLRRH